jgi:prophage regulatory protein
MKILRLTAVLEETGHRSPASIYNAVRDGLFTKQVRIGQRAVGWPQAEVHAINAARIAGCTESQIRDLVTQLHARRSSFLVPPELG